MTKASDPTRARRTPAAFWDKMAERYAKRPVADQQSYEKKLEVTRGYLHPDMDVLEFGCGTGSTALAHAPYVKHIRAIDISSKMIEIARGKAETANIDNVSFEQASIETVSVPDGTLDAVLGMSILHLLDDMHGAIAKVHEMLKPGGLFVTSTPCLEDSHKYFKFVLPLARLLGLAPQVSFFTEKVLEQSLIGTGFKIDHRWQPSKGKAIFIVASATK